MTRTPRRANGPICVIASSHALTASPFKSAYVAAKHGVLGLVKTLALEGAQVCISATGRAGADRPRLDGGVEAVP